MARSVAELGIGDISVADVEQSRASSVTARDYPLAKSYYESMQGIREEHEEKQRNQESQRQASEQQRLQNAFEHLDHDLEATWSKRMDDFEAKCQEMWSHLAERHAVAKAELEKSCEPLLRLSPKFSPELLQMERSEIFLAKQHMYSEAQDVRRRTQVRKAVELADFNDSRDKRIKARFARLERSQDEERKELHSRIHGMRTEICRRRDQARRTQAQRKANNFADMRHAHKIEYSDIQARVPGLQVKPRKRFMQTSSTFKGTHICRELAKTHMPGSWGGVLAVIDMQNTASKEQV